MNQRAHHAPVRVDLRDEDVRPGLHRLPSPTVCTWQISLASASFMAGAKERGSPKDSITAAGWRWARQSGPPQPSVGCGPS